MKLIPILSLLSLVAMFVSYKINPSKTKEGFTYAFTMVRSMASGLVGVMLAIGLLLALLPQDALPTMLGGNNLIVETLSAALIGCITIIPAFAAFPLVGSLLDAGGHILPLTAFLTTLTMVGIATYPIESATFGRKFTLIRNGLSLLASLIIAGLLGGVFI
tara:strand:- start:2707 stop:3189 length:483 start_codon:yes stop_codon:yes gene_type:complete